MNEEPIVDVVEIGDVPPAIVQPPASGIRIHVVLLVGSLIVLATASLMTIQNRSRVALPFFDSPIVELCTFKKATGYPCPGCGMTRTFISAAHFHLLDAISYNPVGLVFFGIVVFQIPFRLAQIHRISRGRPPLNLGRFEQWLLLSLCLAMTVQWLVRLAIHAFG